MKLSTPRCLPEQVDTARLIPNWTEESGPGLRGLPGLAIPGQDMRTKAPGIVENDPLADAISIEVGGLKTE
jgi:hypothetical protein